MRLDCASFYTRDVSLKWVQNPLHKKYISAVFSSEFPPRDKPPAQNSSNRLKTHSKQPRLCLYPSISARKHQLNTIMTTGLAGGLTKPYKGMVPAALTRSEDLATAPLSHGGPFIGAAFYLPFFTGSPVNGSISSFIVSCS